MFIKTDVLSWNVFFLNVLFFDVIVRHKLLVKHLTKDILMYVNKHCNVLRNNKFCIRDVFIKVNIILISKMLSSSFLLILSSQKTTSHKNGVRL